MTRRLAPDRKDSIEGETREARDRRAAVMRVLGDTRARAREKMVKSASAGNEDAVGARGKHEEETGTRI